MQRGGERLKGFGVKRWLAIALPLGLLIVIAGAAVAVAHSESPGDNPGHSDNPAHEGPDNPGEPGGDSEGDNPGEGNHCLVPPPGLEDEVARLGEAVKAMFEGYDGPITRKVIKKFVLDAAREVGVTDPAVVDYMLKEMNDGLPGGDCEGSGDSPGGNDDGVPDGGFRPGFLKRVWRVVVEVDDVQGRVLDVTVVRFVKLRKHFRHEDDEIIDAPALVLFNKRARLRGSNGKRISLAEFAQADRAVIKAKLLGTKRWRKDQDGEITPTFRGKRGRVLGSRERPGRRRGPGGGGRPGDKEPPDKGAGPNSGSEPGGSDRGDTGHGGGGF